MLNQRQSAKAKLCIFVGLGNSLLVIGHHFEAVQALEKSVKVLHSTTQAKFLAWDIF